MAHNADAEALFAAHETGLLRYLRRAVGHAETARDLTQDVFVRVARAGGIPVADDERRQGLVHRQQRVLRCGTARVRARRRAVGQPDLVPPPMIDRQVSRDPEDPGAALDPLDRDAFLLRETAGLSYAEIAAACELTVAAVRSRIHRARLELRDRLRAPIAAVLAKEQS